MGSPPLQGAMPFYSGKLSYELFFFFSKGGTVLPPPCQRVQPGRNGKNDYEWAVSLPGCSHTRERGHSIVSVLRCVKKMKKKKTSKFFWSRKKTSKPFNSTVLGKLIQLRNFPLYQLSMPEFCILFYKDFIKVIKTKKIKMLNTRQAWY